MLITLCIEHFAIVQSLELDLTKGMTAFTGETGAGKSIMIDALMLALGARADASVIRPGQEKCDITAGFVVDKDSGPAQWLREQEIWVDEGEFYIRRVIYAEGRSKSYINGQLFPVQKIKELSEQLVHIHGQHQHQTLMLHGTHRQQLDKYAQHDQVLDEVENRYKAYQSIKQKITHLQNLENQSNKIQLLEFQLAELTTLDLQPGEIQALHQEHQMLHHAKDYLEHSQGIQALLRSEEQPDICSGLNHILQLISHLPQDHLQIKSLNELINNALIHCEEALDEIQQFAYGVQLDPERLHEIEARMQLIHSLARKHHIDASELPFFTEQLEEELKSIQNTQGQLAQLEDALQVAFDAYQTAALSLRQSRQLHAQKLAQKITSTIHQLGMPKGRVEIEITPLDTIQAHGLDKVEYKVCTNPGMEIDSLNKIASGGELSRIGLAIQMITAEQGSTPTLLFDEVDVGIGGSTAALVGQMLRQLGERLQVFCVTHQPQVAACAHQHYQVEKRSDDHQTTTGIRLLNAADKISEIARMLGGLTITEQTLSHARELISETAWSTSS